MSVDPLILNAWITARSIARGLPQPIAEYGGFRVDTNTDAEVRRWVFPRFGPGIEALGRFLNEPRYFLKLCGEADELRSALPHVWVLHAPSYFMQGSGAHPQRSMPDGYRIDVRRAGMVVEARVLTNEGLLAASGYAAETQGIFIYDRIVTDPGHGRKGLGSVVMAALQSAKELAATPEFLVATEEGRALYATLGWRTISAYSTASIPI
jgi:hypothetical protein